MYIDQSLQQYLDDLASDHPTPGGGSASALTGAMGAALASMVARLTLGKAEYAAVQQEIKQLVQHTESIRQRFQQLMQADIDAYGQLSAAFKLPKATAEESAARSEAIQEKLMQAALVPLEMVECAAELTGYCLRIAEIGNARVLSDIATSAMLTASAGSGAAWMVRVNTRSMKNLELAGILTERLSRALDVIAEQSQQVTSIVGRRA